MTNELVLNATPLRTSQSYQINDLKIKLDIPEIKEFANAQFKNIEKITLKKSENTRLSNKIGLELQTNYSLNIIVPKYTKIEQNIELNFKLTEEALISKINIKYEQNSEANIIIKFEGSGFNYSEIELQSEEYSKGKITIANLLESTANTNIFAISNNIADNSEISHIIVDFGGENKISNYYSELNGYRAKNSLKTVYLGQDNNRLDLNYHIKHIAEKTNSEIEVQGAIDGNSKKSFKGTIDFIKGSKESKGTESENCVLLSDKAKSISLPMLLCHEDDVNGEHGVSSGKIDPKKLFYIMTKGISYEDARKLIIKANFNNIINEIPDEELQEKIMEIIEKI